MNRTVSKYMHMLHVGSVGPMALKMGCIYESNSNGSCQKWGAKYHFVTLNSVLASMNSVFTPMVGAKMGCHFNNSMFFIKKI